MKISPSIISNYKYDNTDNPASRELIRLNLKEKFLKIILEGNVDSARELDELFYKNPDR